MTKEQSSGASKERSSAPEGLKMLDTTREAVERLRSLLSYGLPPHVAIQTGEGTDAPAAVFADADYEVGDGTCGLHASGKQANEPCIPYVRADALMHALAAKEAAEARIDKLEAENAKLGKKLNVARYGPSHFGRNMAPAPVSVGEAARVLLNADMAPVREAISLSFDGIDRAAVLATFRAALRALADKEDT